MQPNSRLVLWLLKFVKSTGHLGNYMLRYWLFRPKDKSKIQIRLHNIRQSDIASALHNHPWPWFISLVLQGEYDEVCQVSKLKQIPYKKLNHDYPIDGDKNYWYYVVKRRKWSIKFYTHEHFHRIIIKPDTNVWTLFITGKVLHEWGFLVNDLFINHRHYRGQRNDK